MGEDLPPLPIQEHPAPMRQEVCEVGARGEGRAFGTGNLKSCSGELKAKARTLGSESVGVGVRELGCLGNVSGVKGSARGDAEDCDCGSGGKTANNDASTNGGSNDDSHNFREELKNLMEGLAMGQMAEDSLQEISPPDGTMRVRLLRHQKVALTWMLKREEARQPAGGILADDQGLGKTVTTLALIVSAPRWRGEQENRRGGASIAWGNDANDVCHHSRGAGNGHEPCAIPRSLGVGGGRDKGLIRGGTLVVCPTAVLFQWASELREKIAAQLGLRVLLHHGPSRPKLSHVLATYDVVLTTYALVTMEVPGERLNSNGQDQEVEGGTGNGNSKGRGALGGIMWWRVVLDEAQSMKNARTRIALSCSALQAERRWCLTGTPMQNSIDDLYSYFRFLRYSPYENMSSFKSMISQPVAKGLAKGWTRLRTILKSVMLRRTKDSKMNGEPLVRLPPRIIKTMRLTFSEQEQKHYQSLMDQLKKQFQTFQTEGTLSKNYVNILWMLLRLRQACNHPSLSNMRSRNGQTNGASNAELEAAKRVPKETREFLLKRLNAIANLCPVCMDAPEEAVIGVCGHLYCRQCAMEQIADKDSEAPPFTCCECQMPLGARDFHSAAVLQATLLQEEEQRAENGSSSRGKKKRYKSSTKIQAVLAKLREIHPYKIIDQGGASRKKSKKSNGGSSSSAASSLKRGSSDAAFAKALRPLAPPPPNPNHVTMSGGQEKVIIFSQWTAMLDLLEEPLEDEGYKFRRLDGTMSVSARQQALRDFTESNDVTVMLMSLKAASLGLNMVCASHVLLLDLWWCPTTEDQAIDRCHRIGQRRTVKITRFIVEGSVEERILQIQEKKRQLVAAAFEWNEDRTTSINLSMNDLMSLFTADKAAISKS